MILYGHESSMIWSMNRCKIQKWTRTDAHLNTMQTLESMISSINMFLNSHSYTQKGTAAEPALQRHMNAISLAPSNCSLASTGI